MPSPPSTNRPDPGAIDPSATGPGGAIDPRAIEWLTEVGWAPSRLEPLPGDVSPRRYTRVRGAHGASAILATYPESVRDACSRFESTATLLREQSVPVPRILAVDHDAGRMLVEDLGTETLYERRDRGWGYLGPLIEEAATLIPLIQGLPVDPVAATNPPLDAELLAWELENTWRLGLGGRSLPPALGKATERMIERLAASPRVPCHRDFMARNLIPPAAGDDPPRVSPAVRVIDFQDLRLGPRGYDLASLLNDSLFAPPDLERRLLERMMPSPEDREDYHRNAAQRGLKIVGTYLGFARRGAPRHLPLVEPSLERTRRHLAVLPELDGLETKVDDLLNALAAARA